MDCRIISALIGWSEKGSNMELKKFAKILNSRDFPMDFPGHWIGGEWIKGNSTVETKASWNPNRNEKLIEFPIDRSIMKPAIDAGQNVLRAMAASSLEERLERIKNLRQAFADFENEVMLALRLEGGRPVWEARVDFENALGYLDKIINEGPDIDRVLKAPYVAGGMNVDVRLNPEGVTLAFIPFSDPWMSFVQYFSSCILAGCPVVFMSSSHAVLNSLLFARLAENVGLPDGAMAMLFGDFTMFRLLMQDDRIRAVLYRGSMEHCTTLQKENKTQGRKMVLQSGGKNAIVVDASASVDDAVNLVCWGAFKSAGQLCSSTSRVFLPRQMVSDFADRLIPAVRGMRIGPAGVDEEPRPFMGPLYSRKAVDKFLRFQTMAKREPGKTLLWGKSVEVGEPGYFVSPGVHLLERFNDSNAYQGNVLLFPDIALYEYDRIEDAIAMANSTMASLVTSFVGDPAVLESRQHLFEAPNLVCNLPTVEAEGHLTLSGKLHCGSHRLSGVGLTWLLTWPQAVQAPAGGQQVFKAWPGPGI